jgi:ribonuclease P protein component
MLASANRLRKASDIVRVYKRGSYGGASGVLSAKALQSGRPESRLVVVVGKKVSKRAVIRNRIRRQIIGDIRRRWATLKPGYDIVVSVHQDVSELPADKLAQNVSRALSGAGVITNKSAPGA